MTVMVSVNLNFLKKMLAKNGQFSLLTGPRGLQCDFRLRSHKNVCLEFNKESKNYIFIFLIYLILVKKQIEKKGKAKKYIFKS